MRVESTFDKFAQLFESLESCESAPITTGSDSEARSRSSAVVDVATATCLRRWKLPINLKLESGSGRINTVSRSSETRPAANSVPSRQSRSRLRAIKRKVGFRVGLLHSFEIRENFRKVIRRKKQDDRQKTE